MHDVFISYKVEEIDEALKVRNFLQSKGIKCWMAPDSITGGSSYAAEITAAIKNCKVFVLILSPLAQTSIHVTREYSLADKNKKPVLPFCIKYCATFSDDFEYLLSVTQYYTAFENWNTAADKLVADLYNRFGIGSQNASSNTNISSQNNIPQAESITKQQNFKSDNNNTFEKKQVGAHQNEKRTVFNTKS